MYSAEEDAVGAERDEVSRQGPLSLSVASSREVWALTHLRESSSSFLRILVPPAQNIFMSRTQAVDMGRRLSAYSSCDISRVPVRRSSGWQAMMNCEIYMGKDRVVVTRESEFVRKTVVGPKPNTTRWAGIRAIYDYTILPKSFVKDMTSSVRSAPTAKDTVRLG